MVNCFLWFEGHSLGWRSAYIVMLNGELGLGCLLIGALENAEVARLYSEPCPAYSGRRCEREFPTERVRYSTVRSPGDFSVSCVVTSYPAA